MGSSSPSNLNFPRNLMLGKGEKAEAQVPVRGELTSQKEISDSSDNLSDYPARETGWVINGQDHSLTGTA